MPTFIQARTPLCLAVACGVFLAAPVQAAQAAQLRLPEVAEAVQAVEAPPEAPEAPEADDEGPDLTRLPWRHGQLQLHQAFGLGTLGAMAATGGLGYWLARQNGTSGVFDAHLLMAGLTTGLYLTSATLALTAPPSPLRRAERPGDTTGLHRNLAWLHAAGMVSTVGLGLASTYGSLQYSPYHGLAAYGTLGLMALSAGVIYFGE